jgi:hypothetical protein
MGQYAFRVNDDHHDGAFGKQFRDDGRYGMDELFSDRERGTLGSGGCVNSGDAYIQYQATLSTSNPLVSPSLASVNISETGYASSGTLISQPYNSGSATNILGKIGWTESTPPGAGVSISLSTATSSAGLGASWSDLTDTTPGCSATGGVVTCPGSALSSSTQSSATWWQYKVTESSTGANTPTVSGVTVMNSPIITTGAVAPTGNSVTIGWTTDEAATAQVSYGLTSAYGSSTATSTLATNHSITLSGLTASTTYHYQILSTDAQGNTATTSDATVFTIPDVTPPAVAWVSPANNATLTGTVPLTASSTDNVQVASVAFYEGSFGASFASSTFVGSSAVASGTQYSFSWNTITAANGSTTLWALATDVSNNTSTASTTVNIENPPIITASTPSITTSSAIIAWTTNNLATSQINYGLTSAYGSSTATSTLATNHSIALSGLTASTTYHYQLLSTDAQGNTATTSDAILSTATIPPVISGVSSGTPSGGGTIITWLTSVPSISYVNYGTSTTYTASSSVTVSTTTPTVALAGLAANTTYHFQVVSSDGMVATSSDYVFTTGSDYLVAHSSVSDAFSRVPDRTLWRTSDNNLALIYQDSGYLYYTTSTNGGSTWSSPVTIDFSGASYKEFAFSSYMDASNNIYITYLSSAAALYEVKLTYNNSGSWFLGAKNIVDSETGLDYGYSRAYPSIIADAQGTLWVAYSLLLSDNATSNLVIKSSADNGTTWSSSPTYLSATSSVATVSALALYNNQYPLVVYDVSGNKYARTYNGSLWSSPVVVDNNNQYDASQFSVTSIGNNILFVDGDHYSGAGLNYSLFNGSSKTWSALTSISSSSADQYNPQVVTDGTNAWVVYSNSTNGYNIYYRKWNGTSWDAVGTPLTTTGNNNLSPRIPPTISPFGTIPYVYISGSAAPYTINYNSFPTALVASNISTTVSYVTATITWNTNVGADTLINYGTSTSYTASSRNRRALRLVLRRIRRRNRLFLFCAGDKEKTTVIFLSQSAHPHPPQAILSEYVRRAMRSLRDPQAWSPPSNKAQARAIRKIPPPRRSMRVDNRVRRRCR